MRERVRFSHRLAASNFYPLAAGIPSRERAERMVETLRSHGSIHSWVVHGGGLDDLAQPLAEFPPYFTDRQRDALRTRSAALIAATAPNAMLSLADACSAAKICPAAKANEIPHATEVSLSFTCNTSLFLKCG